MKPSSGWMLASEPLPPTLTFLQGLLVRKEGRDQAVVVPAPGRLCGVADRQHLVLRCAWWGFCWCCLHLFRAQALGLCFSIALLGMIWAAALPIRIQLSPGCLQVWDPHCVCLENIFSVSGL